jgi:hypothetical protein
LPQSTDSVTLVSTEGSATLATPFLPDVSQGVPPDRVAYPQGAYEVLSTRLASGSGETLVDTALELLRENFRDGAGK